jgi:hypothetical protein
MTNCLIGVDNMRTSFMGFSVTKMAELNIDLISAGILRWFCDFQKTKTMKEISVNNKVYYWVLYDALLKDCPNIKIGKVQLSRRFKHLVEIGVLKHHTHKNGGVFSYYTFGPNINELTNDKIKYQDILSNIKVQPSNIETKMLDTFEQKSTNTFEQKCSNKDKLTKNNKHTKQILANIKYTKEHSDIAIKIANHVLSLNPGDRFLNNQYDKTIHNWSDEIRKMTDIDKRQIDYIIKVLDFAINDDFWCDNILSGSKLRQKYDTLYVQMQKKQNRNKPKRDIERDGYGYNQAQ